MNIYHYTGGGANRSPAEVEQLNNKYDVFDIAYIHKIFKDILNLVVKEIQKPINTGLPHVTYIASFQ